MSGRLRRLRTGTGLGATLLRAVAGSSGLRILGMGFSFLAGIQLARGLGVEGYGVYGLAMSIIAMLTIPTEFGVPQLLTREVAAAQVREDPGGIRSVIRWGRRTVLTTSVAVAVLVFAWLWWSGKGLTSALGMTLAAGLVMVPLVALGNLQSASLRGLQQIVKGQLPDTLVRPVLFSGLLAIAAISATLNQPYVAMALGAIAAGGSCLLASVLLWRALPRGEFDRTTTAESGTWLWVALPMALTEGMRVLQAHVVVIALGALSTAVMVGFYRVATSAAQFIALVVTIFNVVAAPIISRLYAKSDREELQRVLRWLALGMSVGTAALALPFLVIGDWLIALAFGKEFVGATTPLRILCLGAVGNAFFGVGGVVLNMSHHEKRVTRAAVIALVALVLISMPAIHWYGAVGAAVANVLSMLLWRFVMWADCRRLLGVDCSLLGFAYSKVAPASRLGGSLNP